jgi:hypothetical protein
VGNWEKIALVVAAIGGAILIVGAVRGAMAATPATAKP